MPASQTFIDFRTLVPCLKLVTRHAFHSEKSSPDCQQRQSGDVGGHSWHIVGHGIVSGFQLEPFTSVLQPSGVTVFDVGDIGTVRGGALPAGIILSPTESLQVGWW